MAETPTYDTHLHDLAGYDGGEGARSPEIPPQSTPSRFDSAVYDALMFDGGAGARSPDTSLQSVPRWFSTAINQEPGSNVHNLLRALFEAAATISDIHAGIYAAGYVSTAMDAALDALADEWGIYRESGEDDAHFRLRIASERRIADSTGTAAEIRRAVADTLAMSPDDILVLERYQAYPQACFTVRLLGKPGTVVNWADVDALINIIRAAGTWYESPGYVITYKWVEGVQGFGYSGWGSSWGS